MAKLTNNFDESEFRCKDKDGTPWPAEERGALDNLAKDMQIAADAWHSLLCELYERIGIERKVDSRIQVVSAYRTLEYNRSVGSNDTSQHTDRLGNPAKNTPPCAADIRPMLQSISELRMGNDQILRMFYLTIRRCVDEGEMAPGGLGLYFDSNFVHYDNRGLYGLPSARWGDEIEKGV